jgi:hypothetical protein
MIVGQTQSDEDATTEACLLADLHDFSQIKSHSSSGASKEHSAENDSPLA